MPRGRKPSSILPPEANRREELLHAAARLFVEKGFDATTTRDIAQAVGMRRDQVQRNEGPQRIAHDVRALDVQVIEQPQRVVDER